MIKSCKYLYTVSLTLFLTLIFSVQSTAQTVVKDTLPVKKDNGYYFLEGVKNYNSHKYDIAKGDFAKVLELEPKNDAAYFYLSKISLNSNDIVSGEMFLKKAIAIDSSNFWYKELLAKIYLSTKKIDQAIEVYENLAKQFPKRTDIYYNLATLYINAEDVDKSNAILDKIEQLRGKSEATVLTRFNLFTMSQNIEGALKYLIESSKDIVSPQIETVIGDIYTQRYQDSLAMIHYNNAIKIESNYAPAMYGEAELYRRAGNYPMFFKRINPMILNSTVSPRMKSEYLGQLLQLPSFAQKFKPQLDTVMNNLCEAHPTDTTAHYIASSYFSQTGNRDKGRKLLQNMTKLYPNSLNINFTYLTFLYYGEEWDILEQEAAKALETYSNNTDFIQLLGISQYQKNKIEDAIKTYTRLGQVSLKNNDTTNLLLSYSMLGDLYHEINNTKLSYSNYKQALKIDPNYNPVLNNYAYYLALENKNLKTAYEMSKKTIETEPDNPTYLDTFAWILYLMDRPQEAKTHLKHAMLYGGKESAAILDHYAEVLYVLKEYDLAFIYWEQADALDSSLGIKEKVAERKAAMKK